jgi:hypothetical protein
LISRCHPISAARGPAISTANELTTHVANDLCAWIADYAAVRDAGQAGSDTHFIDPRDAPLVQIPGTGVIRRICSQ